MSKISTKEAFEKELGELSTLYQKTTGEEMTKFYRPPQGKSVSYTHLPAFVVYAPSYLPRRQSPDNFFLKTSALHFSRIQHLSLIHI